MEKIGLVYDQIRWEEKAILEAAKKEGLATIPIDAKKISVNLVEKGDKRKFGDIALQRCVSYFRGIHITAIIESKGIPVVNSYSTSLISGNKLLTTLALSKAGVPTPKTAAAFTPEAALKALKEIGYPAILKPVIGSWGRMIIPIPDRDVAEAVFEERQFMHPLHQVYYLQEMVQRPPRDIRVVVVGDEVAAAIYRYASSGDWKTNLARGGKAAVCPITEDLAGIGLKAAEAVGGGVLGVDLMEGPDGLTVHEVNSNLEFKGATAVTKVNIPEKIIMFLSDRVK